ncbi:dehydrodolichyl diphosphate synthase complex subunit Nus1-like [Patiria miniata]|uniref:ditrans,polycis-polyprenyl diphosphate synthase [(2E,6E)-farnesyldiphosphate specific] n=1 Tax=Patiria miniata TaxID=46514 RepID=A0A914BPV4_PATMI|nr:dehydrodolichyl diphosphate synthase complex subunit Nus1-like [Patiria miniata]
MAFYDGAVLKCVHAALQLWTFLWTWFYLWGWKPLLSKVKGQKATLSRCKEDRKSLQKLPCHLGLLVAEQKISYGDVCSLMVWSMALGISYISVYDWHGTLKKNAVLVKSHLDRLQEEIFGKDKSKYTFQLHQSSSKKHSSNEGAQVHILLLSPSDGRLDLVRTAGDYCHAVANRILKPEDISTDLVNSMLHSTKGFPDPDVLVRFGQIESLLGYLPWQIRLTEILSMPTHWGVGYESFLDVLHQFAGTHQRFGK